MTHCMKGSAVTRWPSWPAAAGAINGTPTIMATIAAVKVTPALRHRAVSESSLSAARAAGAPRASSAAGNSAS